MSLIEEILKTSAVRLAERRATTPLSQLEALAASAPRARLGLRQAIARAPFSVIAEIKRRSPSGGEMDPENVERALDIYDARPGMAAISILTDGDHFDGSLDDLRRARARTGKPLLRKDFIVDEYQVWEARAAGADAILLMAGLPLEGHAARLRPLYDLATALGMDALFEIGMTGADLPDQLAAIPAEAPLWGVNSRRFKTSRLQVRATLGRVLGKDISTSADAHRDLFHAVPPGKLAVAESGLDDPAAVHDLAHIGYRAALIGTAFLKRGADVEAVVAAFDREVAKCGAGVQTSRANP